MDKEKKIRKHCHFSTIFESMWQFWAVIVIALVGELDTLFELVNDLKEFGISKVISSGAIYGIGGIAAVSLLVLGLQYLIWRKTWVTLDGNLIIVERNTINKKKNTIAVENISAVNLERNLFERLVGTCRIKLDTNSMTTASETDVSIVFAEKEAMEFRNAIVERMNTINKAAGEQITTEYEDVAVSPEVMKNIKVFSYSPVEIALHDAYSVSLFNILAAIGGIIGLIVLYNLPGGSEGMAEAMGSLVTVLIFLGGFIYNLIKRFIVYYNFSVYRNGDDLHLKYGLLKLKNYTVPIDKIAAIKIVQPTISRLLNKYQVQIITVGLGDENGELTNLIMAMSREKMVDQLKVLLPEFEIEDMFENIVKEERGGAIIRYAKSVKWILLTAAAAIFASTKFTGPAFVIPAAAGGILGFILLLYYLGHKTAGYYLAEDYMTSVSGHFAKEYTICMYNRVQQLHVNSSPVSRKLGMAYCGIQLLNSSGFTPYIKMEDALKAGNKILKKL